MEIEEVEITLAITNEGFRAGYVWKHEVEVHPIGATSLDLYTVEHVRLH
jgi:hypothetical protein